MTVQQNKVFFLIKLWKDAVCMLILYLIIEQRNKIIKIFSIPLQ